MLAPVALSRFLRPQSNHSLPDLVSRNTRVHPHKGEGRAARSFYTRMEASNNGGVLLTAESFDYLVDNLESRFKVFKLWEAEDPKTYAIENAKSIKALVYGTGGKNVDTELLGCLNSLELICTVSAGLDHIDLEWCKRKNIKVTNTPDVVTDDVADLTIALMISTLRQLHAADRYLRQGLWPQQGPYKLTSKLSGKSIGIVGLGRIGLGIAKRGEAFGCPIFYYSRSKKSDSSYTYFSSLHELARNSDILVVACPLTKETKHIIDKSVLDALGPKGILVNIGRGPLVDEKELVQALLEGRIGGAGLDVFENEPHVPTELFDLDNVVLLPHVGTATWESRMEMVDLAIRNLEAYFSNQPLITPVE